MAGILFALETEVFTSVEGYQRLLVDILISGLNQVGLGFQIVVLRLVELGDGGLAVFVLGLLELEGITGRSDRLLRGLLLGLRVQGVVIHLLDLLVERLLRIVELQLLVLLLDTGIANLVTRLETVEDGHAHVQTDILREVVLELFAEGVGLKAGGGVIVGA